MAIEFPIIETERLSLRPLTLQDSEQVFEHFSDESVTEFMDIEPCRSIDEAREIIQFHINDTGCRWGVFDKSNGKLLGTCGYHCWVIGRNPKAEIGFDLSKAYWGKGFMSEALKPVIDYGFKHMGLRLIEATVDPRNARSIQLLRRLGFIRQGKLEDNLILFTLDSTSL
ncbi:GNAT family N-acetyltransferase [Alicyclobacillus macrosporangiidus]|uniref:GNAT family N-acetyltransferase n=1 Tax=Alicyclobacillus macrosporangiidus TaxID=392015 RepID=UPI0026ECD287|nr:GNAT family N-acetyltransferase [Alicyclobacillus macrosporangiidus]